METNHLAHTRPTTPEERPQCLPKLTADDFCKAKYSYLDQRCYTARMLDVFLRDEAPYVAAYREFRLASMDYMYHHHKEDHAANGEQRSKGWNTVAESLGYKLVSMEEYKESIKRDEIEAIHSGVRATS
jgi:hypothetical protein